MNIQEHCQQEKENGYGVALLNRENDRIITPYCGSWDYPNSDEIEQLEIDEQAAATVDGRYSLVAHSGCYEEKYRKQEKMF